MKPERYRVATDRMARIGLMLLATMALGLSAPCRADDASSDPAATRGPAAPTPDATATSPEAVAATHGVSHHRPARHLTVAQSIDESVRRLTRGLDLEPVQQESLRQILVDQHRRILKLRSAGSAGPADVAGTTLAIYDQTKARIRALLNDEQKSKYSADVSHSDLAPAQADLKHWMDLQESKRRQGPNDENPK